MEELLGNIIDEQVKEVVRVKEELLKERLFKILGYELDLDAEVKRRFPRVLKEVRPDQSEHYYWNDGTDLGRFIISFHIKISDMEIKKPFNYIRLHRLYYR